MLVDISWLVLLEDAIFSVVGYEWGRQIIPELIRRINRIEDKEGIVHSIHTNVGVEDDVVVGGTIEDNGRKMGVVVYL